MASQPIRAVRLAVPTKGPWLPLAVGCGVTIFVLAASRVILNAQHTTGWGFDFRAYYDASMRLLATGSPYQLDTLRGPFSPGPAGLYLYSPLPAALAIPFTWVGPDLAQLSWLFLRIGLLFATCALLPVPKWVKGACLVAAVLSGPFVTDLDLGNVSLVVTFLAVVAWRWLDGPVSGVSIATTLAVRPAMGVVWLWWIVRRQWTAVAWTVLGAAGIVLISLPFVGVDPWLEYVTVLRNISAVVGVPNNLDFGSTALSVGLSAPIANALLVGGYALAGAAIFVSLRRDREISFAVTLMATLLLSPLLWDHYLTNLIVPAALLAARGKRWGVLLPLLGWLPHPFFPLVVTAAMLLPFLVPDRGQHAVEEPSDEGLAIPFLTPVPATATASSSLTRRLT